MTDFVTALNSDRTAVVSIQPTVDATGDAISKPVRDYLEEQHRNPAARQ
jgi:hypothetical protein